MEKQPFWPYSSVFVAKTQALMKDAVPLTMVNPMKRKDHHNPEQEIEQKEEDNDVSTELTLSCGFQRKSMKLRTSEASSSKTKKQKTSEASSSKSFPTEKEPFVMDSAHNFSASISRSKKPHSKDALEVELKQKEVARKISAMKYYSPREEAEERRLGVSTKLKLYEDPFKIKKELRESDLGQLCRLLVKTSLVQEHILPYFSRDLVKEIKNDKGVQVIVWDQDTKSEHHLLFKRWRTSKSYVFIDKWIQDFVNRRELKEGDEIGLFWDPYYPRFNFSVLKRAPRYQLVAS